MRRKLIYLVVAGLVLGWAEACAVGAIDPNLIGWWQLDDGAGAIAMDSTARSADAKLVGEPAWSGDGVDGGCLLFDGANDYAFIDGKFRLPAYTMAVWFRADMSGQRDIISAYAPGVMHGVLLEQQADGTLRFLHRFPLGTGGGVNIYSPKAYSDGAWHHAAILKSATDIALYVDGQHIQTMADASVFDPTDFFGVALGVLDNERAVARLWNGAMDDIRIYDRPLSAEEITALMPSRLQAYDPEPADGAVGVAAPLFRWTKGETATLHNLYLGTSPELTEADLKSSGQPLAMYFHVPGFVPGTMYYWRVDEVEMDGVTIHTGNVWSFLTQAPTAYYPTPADKVNTVLLAPTLTWMPGPLTLQHHVYFGADAEAVGQGAAGTDKGTVDPPDASFVPGVLESLTTYFWRVDESVAGGALKTGPVWSFTTCLPVEDFESYTDEDGSRIYQTWIDGVTSGDNGSTVGYLQAPFAERVIVHDANQSMPLDYNNVGSPYYSEAERQFDTAQDWTAGGVDTLILYVRGRPANAPATLYVTIENSSGQSTAVVYPDPQVVTAVKWVEWKIPLTDFTGMDMTRVKKIYIGVGDEAAATPGGKGRIYVDGIALTRP